MTTKIGHPIEPTTIIAIVKTVLSIIAGLGWFSSADWPEELDNAHNELKQVPGVDVDRLDALAIEAHKWYLKQHHAAPWDKPYYLKKFQEAVRAWVIAVKDEAEKAAERIGYDVKPWYVKYLPYGIMAVEVTALIIVLVRRPR